jgi:DivIVA domain-containing protein
VDRDAIERRDFPVARRGYDQGAVDEHLRRVADEIESLRERPAPAPASSLSAGTSEQVRGILEAAERSASELRDDAGKRASAHVATVAEAADGMLSRLDELQGELSRLMHALRSSGERLAGGLAELQERVGGGAAPDPGRPPAPVEDFAAAAPEPEPEPASEPAPAPRADLPDDEAGARIIALNMALGGSSRQETAAYLRENFALADQDALLEDVYSKVGG